jgi:hypothetical protein
MTLDNFFDPTRGSFGPLSQLPDDGKDWNADGPAPLGSLMLFKAPFLGTPIHERMAVVTSVSSDTKWVFTPVTLGPFNPGEHPVAGNREFGIRTTFDGKLHIYAQGADRVYKRLPGESVIVSENFILDGGDALWRSWQAGVVQYIQLKGGKAVALTPTVLRPTWKQVQESGRFRR